MRRYLAIALFLFLGESLFAADDDLTVLKPDAQGVSPRKMLYEYLRAEAGKRFEARRKLVATVKTPEEIAKRRERLREDFRLGLGDLPAERSPLNAMVTGKQKRDGYSVEKVVFESRPGHHVTGVLYVPEGSGPFPGVLVPCGHSVNGKAAETYQRASILFAKNGMVAFCYDPIGQGERNQLLDSKGAAAINGSTTEHTQIGIGAWLVGRSAAGYRVWDGLRAMDYLESRPEVDPKRLGCSGNSGGGTLTAYLMAIDDRIAVAAPSCYITSFERLLATIGPQDAEQNITGQIALGIEHADYISMRAPKPTLLCVGTRDFFDIDGAWSTYREAKLLFGRLGYGERVDLFESDETHGFTKPRREAAMRWLRRWLVKIDDAPVEGDFPIATDAEMLCTKSGQVLSEYRGKSAFDLNAEAAASLAKSRAEPIFEKLNVRPGNMPSVGVVERKEAVVEKLVFETEPGIVVPGLLYRPRRPKKDVPIAVIVGADKARLGTHYERVRLGQTVLAVDLRGMGETAPEATRANAPFGSDSKEAHLGILLNRPLILQRVHDLLVVLESIAKDHEERFEVVGVGVAGPAALHAAVFSTRVSSLLLENSLLSWTDVASTPVTADRLSSVIPGVLKSYDLPDLAAAFAPNPLILRNPLDAAGKPVGEARIRETYARSIQAYANANGSLVIQAGPREARSASIRRAVDLDRGESARVTLSDGRAVSVKLLEVKEPRDSLRSAVREPEVVVEVAGRVVTLGSGNYRLPVKVGDLRIDCPVTAGHIPNTTEEHWGLLKAARLRLWPASGPLVEAGTFGYPAGQKWFASMTQMANEPSYVDGGEEPERKTIYYHSGLDIGGVEGSVPVVSATDAFVASSGLSMMPGFQDSPVRTRYDVVYLVDDRGWYYRYSHMKTIDPAIKPGARIRKGQAIGLLGKEGGSGGWSHLHFEIKSLQPSGVYGTEEGYAFIEEAYRAAHRPALLAVARPHKLVAAGDSTVLDGSRSYSPEGASIDKYEWVFSDGTGATGPKVERRYQTPGTYSEILKVTDSAGNIAYDFAAVQVVDPRSTQPIPPTIHPAYFPTTDLEPGKPVTFKVRTFRSTDGEETWDFGDGTKPVVVRSDGNARMHDPNGYAVTTHAFEKPGDYLVKVERSDRFGRKAVGRLHVRIQSPEKTRRQAP